jgi:hypothetical protein
MVIEHIEVPVRSPLFNARVVALHRGRDAGPFAYLQAVRQQTHVAMGRQLNETAIARKYEALLFKYTALLAAAIQGPVDALLSPPSDHAWQAQPYREALAMKFPNAVDLTDNLIRQGTARAGQDATLQQVVDCLSYRPCGREKDFRAIVIVDDTFGGGTTAAAIIIHLRRCGVIENCEIILACPLWLDMVRSA